MSLAQLTDVMKGRRPEISVLRWPCFESFATLCAAPWWALVWLITWGRQGWLPWELEELEQVDLAMARWMVREAGRPAILEPDPTNAMVLGEYLSANEARARAGILPLPVPEHLRPMPHDPDCVWHLDGCSCRAERERQLGKVLLTAQARINAGLPPKPVPPPNRLVRG